MGGILNADQKISGGLFGGNPGIVKTGWRSSFYRYCNDAWGIETGISNATEIQIVSGLSEGDEVVVK